MRPVRIHLSQKEKRIEKTIVGFQAAEADPVVLANLSRGLVAPAASKFFMRLCLALLLPLREVHCNCNGSLALKTHI